VLSYSVSQRRREIGVRVAFGASRQDIATLVIRDALRMAAIGVTVGMTVAWMTARLLETLLYGVDTHDPRAFVVAPLLLVGVAVLAIFVPARRAASVNPMEALGRY
jgi:ABC-type antimicrobial peptide transport system permease subunit